MKKPQLNFTKEGVRSFFFRHVEKLFFGLACGLILLFVWFGFKTPDYDSITPREMLTKTERADQYIHDNSHWNQLAEYRVADTDAVARIRGAKLVDPNTYTYRQILGTAVFSLEPRRDPALALARDFAVQHVRAQVALVAPKEEGSREIKVGGMLSQLPDSVLTFPADQRMEMFVYRTSDLTDKNRLYTTDAVVGMALIDHELQVKNYRENFQYQRGYDAARDMPEYVFIEVQRKTADTDWRSITRHIYEGQTELAAPAKELADDKYILDNIALPIPSFLGYDYRGISLVDEIPIRNVFVDDQNVRGQEKDQNKEKDENTVDDGDPFDLDDDPPADDESSDKPKAESADGEEEEELVPVRLIRFYDLTPKEVGETYFYRVRVWLKDPNNPLAVNEDIAQKKKSKSEDRGMSRGGGGAEGPTGADGPPAGGAGGAGKKAPKPKKPLSERDLAREVRDRIHGEVTDFPADASDEDKELYKLAVPTEWVEATQPVTIATGFEKFYGGPVDPPAMNRADNSAFAVDESSVKVVANSFQDDLGLFVPAQTDAMCGSLLNFNAVTNLLHPLTWQIKEVFASEDSRGDKKGRRFETEAIILDISGGERQGFSKSRDVYYSPGEFLIMDRNFQFHIHNDIEDETDYRHSNFISDENLAKIEEESKKRRGRDDDDEMGGGGRGRGRGRGGRGGDQ